MDGAEQRQLAPGTMLDDKYRVDELLAVGGMGAVYVGTHVKLRKRVALKVLNPALSTPPMIERFHREAITASQIGHEGIAQVTDLGTSASGEPFLVMELLEGESLGRRLKAAGPLPIDAACELGCSILSPLAAAHRAGIIHRDLKPDNVFLVRQSRGELVKLLDFGISRAAGLEAEFRLTTTGIVLGTPYYMSPEQARGDSTVTPAADLYSLGVILYEMLVGQVPILGDNYNQLIYRVMSGEFRPPSERRPEIPPALEQVILQAMAIDPALRPRSAMELEQTLLPFCRPTFREHVEATSAQFPRATPYPTPAAYGGPGTDQTMLAPTPAPVPAAAPVRRSKVPFVLGAIVVLAIAGGVAAVALTGPTVTTRPTAPVTAQNPNPTASPTPTPTPTPTATPNPTPNPGPGPTPTPTASPNPGPGPNPSPTPTPTASPTPTGASATITLRFAIEPATATITLDGTAVAGSELTVPKDTASHHLRIAAPGYVEHAEDLRFDESQRLAIELEAAPRTPTSSHAAHPHPTPARPPAIESQSPYGN